MTKTDTNSFASDITYLPAMRFREIAELMRSSNDATILFLPGIGRTAVINELHSNDLLRERLAVDKIRTIPLDASLSDVFFIRQLEEELNCIGGSIKQEVAQITETQKICFLVDNFSSDNIERIKFIESISEPFKNDISSLNFSTEIQIATDAGTAAKHNTKDLHRLLRLEYLSDTEAREWLAINQHRHNLALEETTIAEIVTETGGIPALMRTILKNINPSREQSSIEQVTKTEEYQAVSKNLFDRLVVLKRPLTDIYHQRTGKVLNSTKKLLISTRVCKSNTDKIEIRGKWLVRQLAPTDKQSLQFSTQPAKLVHGEFEVLSAITNNHRKLLAAILHRHISQSIATRDELAEIIWGEGYSYSEWALDQQISRLRKELAQLGLKNLVKSIRGKGYVINEKFYELTPANNIN